MNLRTLESSHKLFSRGLIFPMAMLVWGLAWFAMSIFIFLLGRIVPQLQLKPPPLVMKPQPRSPRIHNASPPPSPPPPPHQAFPEGQEIASIDTSSEMRDRDSSTSPERSSKRPLFKPRWSFSTRKSGKSRSSISPKSSIVSEGSSTLAGSSSPPRLFPELGTIESGSPLTDSQCEQDPSSSSTVRPTGSPRAARNVRLPSVKMFKQLSRRISSKQKSSPSTSPGTSPVMEFSTVSSLEDGCFDRGMNTLQPQKFFVSGDESPRQAQPGHLRLHKKNGSVPGEVLTTTFVNPFRIKPRKPKASPVPTDPLASSSSGLRRASGPRRVLNSLHLTLSSANSHATTIPDSPRSSVSSASTSASTFSNPSIISAMSGSSNSPRSVRRTQPYGAPYYAPMPLSSSPRHQPHRRAASLSTEFGSRPETVAEEPGESDAEDANNALGLEFGQSRPPQVRTDPPRRQTRHRLATSESTVLLDVTTQ